MTRSQPAGHGTGATNGAGGVRVPLGTGEAARGARVRVLADTERYGRYAGRTGTIASNELAGNVWVFLGMEYANFRTADLEVITERQ